MSKKFEGQNRWQIAERESTGPDKDQCFQEDAKRIHPRSLALATTFAPLTKKAVNRQRVLVVDDDPETRERGEALEQAGFDPTLAAMGEQGLVLLREWPCRIDWLYTKAELPGLVDG